MRHAIVIETANGSDPETVPDRRGCVATGASMDEVEAEIGEAIRLHSEALQPDGIPIPEPGAIAVGPWLRVPERAMGPRFRGGDMWGSGGDMKWAGGGAGDMQRAGGAGGDMQRAGGGGVTWSMSGHGSGFRNGR